MNKIKVGIIGMGYIGESHIEAVRRIGCCELYAVADTNYELAKKKSEYYGIEKCYSSVEELLADSEIDAVHNCTPNFLHLEINKQIIKSGKHLLSEKPLCMNYEQAKEEYEQAYPAFAMTAEQEGFPQIAASFRQIAEIEHAHAKRFQYIIQQADKMTTGQTTAEQWMCLNCGHIHGGVQLPGQCPVCQHDKGYFVKLSMAPWTC